MLFASAAQLLGGRLQSASDKKDIDWFLNGISHDDLVLFCFSTSNHLFPCATVFVNFCSFVHVLFDRYV